MSFASAETCGHGMLHDPVCDACQVRDRSICADLSSIELESLKNRLTHVSLEREQPLIVEGEPNDSLYVITAGCLRLTKLLADGRRQITGFLFPGDFVGLMPTGSLPFSAEALSASRACRFSHSGLDELSAEHPGIKDRLIQSADTELVKAQDHMMLLGQKTALERVASFFTMLSRRTALEDKRFAVPMSRQDIADYLAIRLETLSRTVKQLKDDGLIDELSRTVFSISDRRVLKSLAMN